MRRLVLTASAVLTFLLIIAAPEIARAHEKRAIAGKYDVEVGWDKEPALVGQMNAASINITKSGTNDPVKGVDQTLKVRIGFGGNFPKEFTLHSVEDKDGYYVADLMPTQAGSYIFTFVGDIEGNPVNEQFESGPNTFDDVVTQDTYQFPKAVPDPLTVANQAQAAQDAANSSRTLAVIGIVVGILGILVGGAALLTRRSARASGGDPRSNAS